jgi:hypothetical protein
MVTFLANYLHIPRQTISSFLQRLDHRDSPENLGPSLRLGAAWVPGYFSMAFLPETTLRVATLPSGISGITQLGPATKSLSTSCISLRGLCSSLSYVLIVAC